MGSLLRKRRAVQVCGARRKMAMASMSAAVAGVEAAHAVSASGQVRMQGSAARLNGFRLNAARLHSGAVSLRSPPARAVVVVRADKAQDAGRDVQKQAENLGDRAADAGAHLEGSAKNASEDARGEVENLGNKARTTLEDAGDSLKRSTEQATSSVQEAGDELDDMNEEDLLNWFGTN